MAELKSFKMKLRFSGATVDRNGLDLYDGATSFYGFAQAIQIAVHAYMTGEVVSRSTALKGAELYFGSPRRGSVIFDIVTSIEAYPVVSGFSAAVFYDFMKYAFARATGKKESKPDTIAVQKLDVDDTFFDRLAETLEGSLQRAHRSIDNGVKQVTLERPRDELIKFNIYTSRWVNTRDENPSVEEFSGNVTRYNSISGNGRAFVHEIDRVIPIRPGDDFPESKRGLLTWSLHGNTTDDNDKELRFWGRRIESAHGEAKRIILSDCAVA